MRRSVLSALVLLVLAGCASDPAPSSSAPSSSAATSAPPSVSAAPSVSAGPVAFSPFMEYEDPVPEPSREACPGSSYQDALQLFRQYAAG